MAEEGDKDGCDTASCSTSSRLSCQEEAEKLKVVTVEQLEVLNLIKHPIWIFDYANRKNRWANDAGLELWSANTLEEFQAREITMSEATELRTKALFDKVERGASVEERWTFHPKGKPKTVNMTSTGIRMSADDKHHSLMVYAVPAIREELDHTTLRGVEMLRHLPTPVCQFDMQGNSMFQNPAATFSLSERPDNDKNEAKVEVSSTKENITFNMDESQRSGGSYYDNHATSHEKQIPFLQRFVNQTVAEDALKAIQNQDHVSLHADLHTFRGPRWSSLQLRKTFDPVTGDPVILFSSRDKSDAVMAKREREASLKRTEFLAIMAHEIRTPLHQVTGFIDLLGQTTLNDEQRSYVKLLESSAEGLMTVISDVLDYSKLEAGKMKIERIPYEPLGVVQATMAAVRGSCEEKSLTLSFDWCKKIPFRLMGDPNRLRQVLLNLLSNAIKFTKEGSIIVQVQTIMGAEENGCEKAVSRRLRFVVQDTGVGIVEKHIDTIFEKYNQGNLSVARNAAGAGLGLSICKLLVSNMGGTIGVDSTIGEGSRFFFELPIEEAANTTNHLPDDSHERNKDTKPSSGLDVLVAEDNLVNQKLVAKMLQRMGHRPTIAENGQVAIDMIEQGRYDVVLMDIQMPVMDGLEATRRLRTMGYSDLPIYGLTASVKRSDYTELGFDDWMAKPIPMKKLKVLLQELPRNGNAASAETQ